MKVKEFLNVLNMQVKYKVTDRRSKEEINLYTENGKVNNEALEKVIYMVFQENDGTLNITTY